MLRDKMVEKMAMFNKTMPENSSEHHRMDMLLSYMEMLGMKPPHNQEGMTSFDIAMGNDTNKWSKIEEQD